MGEGGLADGVAPDLHALGVADELRRGVERHGKALARQDGGGEARGGRLAVGAGYLDAVIAEVGVAQLGKHVLDGLQHGADAKAQRRVELLQCLVIREVRDLEGNPVHLSS